MTYTQITFAPKETRTREISEIKLINLMAQIIVLQQSGEDIEFKRVYSPDYRHLYRYEMIRRGNGKEVKTYFIPSDTQAAIAVD